MLFRSGGVVVSAVFVLVAVAVCRSGYCYGSGVGTGGGVYDAAYPKNSLGSTRRSVAVFAGSGADSV